MAFLVYKDADGIERSHVVGPEPVVIGRAPECAIRSNDPRVSRNHARFFLDQMGTLYIEDLGSSNGVFVGPHPVMCSAVPVGEHVVVGSLTFRHVPPSAVVPTMQQPPAPAPMPPQMQQYARLETQPVVHEPPVIPQRYQQQMPPPQMQQPQMQQPQMQQPQMQQPQMQQPQMQQPQMQQPQMQQPQMQQPFAPVALPDMPTHVPDAEAHLTQQLEAERKAHRATAEERDAYGGRMAQLHQELRALKDAQTAAQQQEQTLRDQLEALRRQASADLEVARAQLATAQAAAGGDANLKQKLDQVLVERTKATSELATTRDKLAKAEAVLSTTKTELITAQAALASAQSDLVNAKTELAATKDKLTKAEAAAGAGSNATARIASLTTELETYRDRLAVVDDQAKEATARVKNLEDELAVARTDLGVAEERLVSELSSIEARASAELASRDEELAVTRADLAKAEDRVMDLSRKIGELEEQLAQR